MKGNEFSYTEISIQKTINSTSTKSYIDGCYSGIDFKKTFFIDSNDKGFLTTINDDLNPNLESGLLFPAILYNFPGFLIFERPPVNKYIGYIDVPVESMNDSHMTKEHGYNLSLPWQLYVAQYDPNTMLLYKVSMYFMTESFKDPNQIMYSPPLPNFFADGSLCRPFFSSLEDVERYGKTLSGVMASAYDWVWNSGFNHDLLETSLTVYNHKKNDFYDPEYTRQRPTVSHHRYLHPKDVQNILQIWEQKFNLENILTAKWANLSVTPLWDSEVEWFYEYDSEYPYEISNDEIISYESLDEYSENYPIQIYDTPKTFKIMMRSVCINNPNFAIVSNRKDKSFSNRFSVYHRLSVV